MHGYARIESEWACNDRLISLQYHWIVCFKGKVTVTVLRKSSRKKQEIRKKYLIKLEIRKKYLIKLEIRKK